MNAFKNLVVKNSHHLVRLTQDAVKKVNWSKAGPAALAVAVAAAEIVIPVAAVGAAVYGACKLIDRIP